ncbi:hypothetical protein J7I98_23555 [Streptomyces sp. ISL-98]|uniref:hypothetical protein n=1 Tax=Streptomyces sp. ISL-98 TaxID=2819192 RepID=UPI001BEB2943|nr:hypothetical protein [Streptomyces sp. ISL-98]MBT2508807.1 hypothetical protein [Streptomyces sp. ISL-98]
MVVYATREDVKHALDSKETARNNGQISRALESASRSIDDLCHRTFAPETDTRRFDYPGSQYARPWRLWLDSNTLISVTSLTSGGVTITADDYFLRRSDQRNEPPFTHVEIDLDSAAAFSSGDTHQQATVISGLFGYRNDETTVGALTAAVGSTTATTISVTGAASALIGIGSVLRIDTERMLVTGRTMADTGQNLGGAGLTAQNNSVTVAVTDGTAYTVDETILIDSERMLIVDIAGNNLTVKRGWDGSVLAAHSAGVDIYAPRTLTVTRGALGTTAATHSSGATAYRWDPPGLVRDLTIAEAIARLTNEHTGYARTRKTGDGGTSEKALDATALPSLRQQVYTAHGRKARTRAV